jgi:hypothetical protein
MLYQRWRSWLPESVAAAPRRGGSELYEEVIGAALGHGKLDGRTGRILPHRQQRVVDERKRRDRRQRIEQVRHGLAGAVFQLEVAQVGARPGGKLGADEQPVKRICGHRRQRRLYTRLGRCAEGQQEEEKEA